MRPARPPTRRGRSRPAPPAAWPGRRRPPPPDPPAGPPRPKKRGDPAAEDAYEGWAAPPPSGAWGVTRLDDGAVVDALYEDDGSPELVAQNVLAISLALLLVAALGGMALRVVAVAAALAAAALRYSVIAVLLLFFAIVFTPRR